MKLSSTIEIDKPPPEVFAFLMDEETLPIWVSNLVRLERISGEPATIGAISKHIYNEKGKIIERYEEMTKYVENKLFEGIMRHPRMDLIIRNELESGPNDDTTLLTATLEYLPKAPISIFVLLFFRKKLSSRLQGDLERLKEAVEKLDSEV